MTEAKIPEEKRPVCQNNLFNLTKCITGEERTQILHYLFATETNMNTGQTVRLSIQVSINTIKSLNAGIHTMTLEK